MVRCQCEFCTLSLTMRTLDIGRTGLMSQALKANTRHRERGPNLCLKTILQLVQKQTIA